MGSGITFRVSWPGWGLVGARVRVVRVRLRVRLRVR